MAKLRMTYKNLKALRKSREYQALLVDLVNESIVPKATAESLLGFNIPSDLLPKISGSGSNNTSPVTDDTDEQNQGSGGESQGSGTEGSGTEGSGTTVTLLYVDETANDGAGEYHTEELVLATNVLADEAAGIIAAAKTAFTDNTINSFIVVEQNPEYVEGTSELQAKYKPMDPQPTELTEGALIACYYSAAVGQ